MDKVTSLDRSVRQLKMAKVSIFTSFVLLSVLLFFASVQAQNSPLKIIDQPKPGLPPSSSTLDVQGSVILLIEFSSTGSIEDVVVLKRLPILTELAIEAAKMITFEPATKDGKPISLKKVATYNYLPGGWSSMGISDFANESNSKKNDMQAESVIKRAVKYLGGDKYLNVKTQVSEGTFSVIRENRVISYQKFTDAIIFPDTQRTDFKGGGVTVVQTNKGDSGWVYDGDQEIVKDQTKTQLDNFRRGIRISLDNLLRGGWKGDATLTYVGKRPSTLGKRNDVVKLTYKDGFAIEFEFSADEGIPQRSIYKTTNDSGEESTETELYAQWITVGGIRTPNIIDRRTNNDPASRINFNSIKFNEQIPDSVFEKPANNKRPPSLDL